jgi:hypothetical protein
MTGDRHDFVIVIPVADRPRHLADCLGSLAELCRRHPYPGEIVVLIADDSLDADNIVSHGAIARDYSGQGFTCHYLSQDAQRALVAGVPPDLRERLAGVLGAGTRYAHKGASITRNIAYLWLRRLQADGRKRLFWFIDSDQQFRVSVATPQGEQLPYAIDYFSALDRIFNETPTRILTGKVVGDPPVSPAVMAGTFLDDVLAFLAEMAGQESTSTCTFHGPATQATGDAAYHDMADLFGFKGAIQAYRYRCGVSGAHDHAACFRDFGARLNRFFDGEHPTRRSHYQADDPLASLTPARTIYTGNYVFKPEGLDWFIPFAGLGLRMAGPTLGRIIRAEIGDAFVAANLPMLHTRTVAQIGRAEFRPGLERLRERVDLSGEFERQYFGDVMLFAMEALADRGYPESRPTEESISGTVDAVESSMRQRYRAKQVEVADKIERTDALFQTAGRWWLADDRLVAARKDFSCFLDNMRGNFAASAPGWRLIDSGTHVAARKAAISAAIVGYRNDRAAWRAGLMEATR